MTVLLTGTAGFIGFHVAQALLARGEAVTGVDNHSDYYDAQLKQARLARLEDKSGFTFHKIDFSDRESMLALAHADFSHIVHLGARPGVRYSLVNLFADITSNVMGHVVVLELARALKNLTNMFYARSSSVYGGNTKLPFAVDDTVDTPQSLYAATKRSDELISHTYAHLYDNPQVGLRFFIVYGPRRRPDMAPMLFADAMLKGEPICVFNNGEMWRGFTLVDAIVAGVLAAMDRAPTSEPPHQVYHLGNKRCETLTDFIAALERELGVKAEMRSEPMRPGDVVSTYADIEETRRVLGFSPTIPISTGVPKFVEWYRVYYGG